MMTSGTGMCYELRDPGSVMAGARNILRENEAWAL